jgi:hypothetical protein
MAWRRQQRHRRNGGMKAYLALAKWRGISMAARRKRRRRGGIESMKRLAKIGGESWRRRGGSGGGVAWRGAAAK